MQPFPLWHPLNCLFSIDQKDQLVDACEDGRVRRLRQPSLPPTLQEQESREAQPVAILQHCG